MNQDLRKTLAGFVSQRMEMGETEWHTGKIILKTSEGEADFRNDGKPAVKSEKPVHASEVKNKISSNIPQMEESGDLLRSKETKPDTSGGIKSCVHESIDDRAMLAADSLEELNRTVCGCLRCGLGSTRTNFVFGTGNPGADIMFIGEAPGADEDLQGKPFVGRAGQLLTKMIEAMHFSRDDVYIGNILKCRPPENRDPKPDEIEVCEPILLRQIEIIKPKIICALGRISGQTLLRTQATLGSLRGKFHDYHGVKLLITYHPAALLRNPNWKPAAWDDLKLLRREYDGLEL